MTSCWHREGSVEPDQAVGDDEQLVHERTWLTRWCWRIWYGVEHELSEPEQRIVVHRESLQDDRRMLDRCARLFFDLK